MTGQPDRRSAHASWAVATTPSSLFKPLYGDRAPVHRPAPEARAVQAGRATYTVPEVAEMLGISRATVYVLLRAGEIPARRVGSRWIIARRRFDSWLDGGPGEGAGVAAVL